MRKKQLVFAGLFLATALLSPCTRGEEAPQTDPRYPFRTDFANPDLPWYQPKPLEFPPHHSGRTISGDLVAADFIHRAGQFRASDTGALTDFTMAPYAAIHYLGAEADLRDVPLRTPFDFVFAGARLVEMRERTSKPADASATEEQAKKFADFTRKRGVPGWIDKTEGTLVTVTFFSGDARTFKQTWMSEFVVGKSGGKLCVANDELRTWNPPVDGEGFTVAEVRDVPKESYGCSGVQIVVKVTNMLEGFRRGRVVRVFAPGWKAQDQFYGESLMGYGFGRLLDNELVELPPKEYPGQFPFRTDYGNEQLPWFQLKTAEAPPPFAEHLVFGELVKADAATNRGQFRADRTGDTVDFTLIPEGSVKVLNSKATLTDLTPGTRCRFSMFQDDKGAFTRASLVSDEYSFLASNFVTYRIDALKLPEGRLHVARQIPEVKNYNGDMERPPDIGRSELRVNGETRVWKGEQQVNLSDLAVGDALLVNLSGELPGAPSRCTDIWIGEETHKLVTTQQSKKLSAVKK